LKVVKKIEFRTVLADEDVVGGIAVASVFLGNDFVERLVTEIVHEGIKPTVVVLPITPTDADAVKRYTDNIFFADVFKIEAIV
jgi:hypothetical protein